MSKWLSKPLYMHHTFVYLTKQMVNRLNFWMLVKQTLKYTNVRRFQTHIHLILHTLSGLFRNGEYCQASKAMCCRWRHQSINFIMYIKMLFEVNHINVRYLVCIGTTKAHAWVCKPESHFPQSSHDPFITDSLLRLSFQTLATLLSSVYK